MYFEEDERVGYQDPVAAFMDRKRRDAENIMLHDSVTIEKARELYEIVRELFFVSKVYLNAQQKDMVVKITNAKEHHARINNPSLFRRYEAFVKEQGVVVRHPNAKRSTNVTLHVKAA